MRQTPSEPTDFPERHFRPIWDQLDVPGRRGKALFLSARPEAPLAISTAEAMPRSQTEKLSTSVRVLDSNWKYWRQTRGLAAVGKGQHHGFIRQPIYFFIQRDQYRHDLYLISPDLI